MDVGAGVRWRVSVSGDLFLRLIYLVGVTGFSTLLLLVSVRSLINA